MVGMTLKVGFSGTQHGTTYRQLQRAVLYLNKIFVPGAQFHQGCCIGADEQVALAARGIGYWIVGHPPINGYKMSNFICDELRPPADFLVRDHNIVDETDELLTCPKTPYEVLRSGTWATIRYARKVHPIKPITIIDP